MLLSKVFISEKKRFGITFDLTKESLPFMKTIYAFLICLLFSLSAIAQQSETNAIASAIKAGNASGLRNYMTSTINLSIENSNDFFPKAQATQVLNNFFSKHPVKNFALEHEGKSRQGKGVYNIGKLQTANGSYRVSFHLIEENGKFLIKQLRIESKSF